jgi:hypothetical protein
MCTISVKFTSTSHNMSIFFSTLHFSIKNSYRISTTIIFSFISFTNFFVGFRINKSTISILHLSTYSSCRVIIHLMSAYSSPLTIISYFYSTIISYITIWINNTKITFNKINIINFKYCKWFLWFSMVHRLDTIIIRRVFTFLISLHTGEKIYTNNTTG